ncbi:MAG: YitT family protein [Candidatus Aenigmatarchaeota archaeon]
MEFIRRNKFFSKQWFLDYFLIITGALLMSAGFAFFADPYRIVPGGIYGIAIVIHHVFGLPTGTVGLVLNIPLFILGIIVLGPRFGVKTFVGTILTSVFIDLLSNFYSGEITDDVMLISVVSGVLIGAGLALIFKAGATTGGSDIIAQIINKYTSISVGQLLIVIDSLIVSVGIIAFRDFSLAFYAFITIFITGKVIDGILLGGSYRKAVFIISNKHDEIRKYLLKNLDRGGTYLDGRGMYRGNEKHVIYTVINRREFTMLKEYVRNIDENAFMTVFDSNEVFGHGFIPFSKKNDIS